MLEFSGKYNKAKVMIDNVDGDTINQIYHILNNPAFEESRISIMPDCHVGSGAVVGFTMKMNNYIVPSIIGVDIGCGIEAYNLGKQKKLKLDRLDKFINSNIPHGTATRSEALEEPKWIYPLSEKIGIGYKYISTSLGTLGGGNHFIELDRDDDQNIWLVIHTGSRGLGYEVAKYHQSKAKEYMKKLNIGSAYGGLEYLVLDEGGREYIEDMQLTQRFAELNRKLIAMLIIEEFFKQELSGIEVIKSIHNYINLEDGIIRKGAISAQKGKKLIIPFNMAFGCLIGTGKGNPEYNFSAPHGAGRVMSRTAARDKVSLEIFQKSMKGIYSSTISKHTLDEAPMVYKKPNLILENITETVEGEFFIKPIYNFKSCE